MTIDAALDSHGLFSGPPRYEARSPWAPIPAILVTVVACVTALVVGISAIIIGIALSGGAFTQSDAGVAAFFSLASPSGVATAMATQLASLTLIWLSAGYKGMRRGG